MAKEIDVSKGDKVNVVLAGGEIVQATVKSVRAGGKLDLEFEHKGETVNITSSPLDESGKRPDCWHPIVRAAAKDAPKA